MRTAAFAAVFLAVQVALLPYALNLLLLAAASWRAPRRAQASPPPPPAMTWPRVTVQLPLYNEAAVAARLLEAVGALDYPRDRLEIQVLDDSTDETTAILAEGVRRLAARGLTVRHLRRGARTGYKAGFLIFGLGTARGDLVAIFDADFVPPRDFLTRLVPRFADPAVGAVQARIGFLNRHASLVTVAAALMQDVFSHVEQRGRAAAGVFLSFAGSAGIWRRSAIEDAGGWSYDTLTEDLDLSFRAQLRGWRIVFEPDVVADMELPQSFSAFRSQQRRWTTGFIQTALKLGPALLDPRVPSRTRYAGLIHLTTAASCPLLLALLLMSAPAFGVHAFFAREPLWAAAAQVLGLVSAGPLVAIVYSQVVQGGSWWRRLGQLPSALLIAPGIAWEATLGVAGALRRGERTFVRTPKTGSGRPHDAPSVPRERAPFPWNGAVELGLALYCAWTAWWHLQQGLSGVVPFLALAGLSFLTVGGLSVAEFALARRVSAGAIPRRSTDELPRAAE